MIWYDSSKSILENIYLLSGPIVAIISVVGLYNIFLLKKGIITSTRRDAANHTIKQTDFFCNTIIPLYDEYMHLCKSENIKGIPCEISLLKTNIESFKIDKGEELYNSGFEKIGKYEDQYRIILNKIELVALTFYKGVALEQMGFEVIGLVFCEVVKELSFEIASQRENENDYTLEHILRLYDVWSVKLNKEQLKMEKKKASKKLKTIKTTNIKTI